MCEIGLEVNAEKIKYMVMSREQTAGLSHTMKADNTYLLTYLLTYSMEQSPS